MPSRSPRCALLLSAASAASVAVFAVPLGCSSDESPARTQPPVAGTCLTCGAPSGQGVIKNPSVAEASGLTASALHDDVIYVHNDAGDDARFFAMSRSGEDLGTFNVSGAENDDWEDIARGPCIPGSCLFISDTGDNNLERDEYTIYRVAEPSSIKPGEQSLVAEKLSFVYPDGRHDAETLLVHPLTGAVTIVTKVAEGASPIFELPLSPGKTATAIPAGQTLSPTGSYAFTGGSVHPQATGVLLRTNTNLFYYPMKPEQTVAEALSGGACTMLVADEKQGEAVTWMPGGAAYMTAGEGEGASITMTSCGP